jgi:cardiolipin synthase
LAQRARGFRRWRAEQEQETVLILKLTMVPLALLLLGIAERLHGPRVAGWLSGFPVVAAPLLLFVTLDQGERFGSAAARGAYFGLLPWLAFTMSYAYVARRWGFTSRFGAWLDPVADKLLMLFCLTALYGVGATPVWLLALVVARDAAIATGWLLINYLSLPQRSEPLLIGKISTVVQVLYILSMLLLLALDIEAPGLAGAAAWITGLVTVMSGAAYAGGFLRGALMQKNPVQKPPAEKNPP